MRYPGTLTLPSPDFQRVVEYAARSLRAGGFREVVLLGDSGDNQAPLRAAAARLAREWAGSGARVHFASEYYTTGADPSGPFASWLRAQGERQPAIGTHAGLADTSMLLAVDPRMVRADRLGTAGAEPGVTGDPARARAEYGRRGLELRVEAAVVQIRRLIAAPAGTGR
jgi:creatinine amidohydrolase/Fe(II)-dependent formamide hydrolase-like protein